jgi:hypothetical protein
MTSLIVLPENSVLDCQRNGTALYYVPASEEGQPVSWFFLDAGADSIRWSSGADETTNFISNCIIDEIITEEKRIDEFWSGLSQDLRIELMKLVTNLPNPTAVACWSLPPEAVRTYLEKNPDTIREFKRKDV